MASDQLQAMAEVGEISAAAKKVSKAVATLSDIGSNLGAFVDDPQSVLTDEDVLRLKRQLSSARGNIDEIVESRGLRRERGDEDEAGSDEE